MHKDARKNKEEEKRQGLKCIVKKRMMGKGEDVEKAVQRRHRRPSFFSLFFRFSFLVWRALSWRREAAPLVYIQGTSNSQMRVWR